MGQTVELRSIVALGDVIVIDTDRSFTGQDGETSVPGDVGEGVPGELATRLFDLGLGIDHVFVQQNTVTVRRPGGWDAESKGLVEAVAGTFLRYYGEEE
jgi:hypothetical protein